MQGNTLNLMLSMTRREAEEWNVKSLSSETYWVPHTVDFVVFTNGNYWHLTFHFIFRLSIFGLDFSFFVSVAIAVFKETAILYQLHYYKDIFVHFLLM